MKLVIFDLDQTLVDFLPVHDEAARRLFWKLFHVDARLTEIDYAGRSLTDSFRELARVKNIPEDVFHKKSRLLLESYEAFFSELIPGDAEKYVLPGARELLGELSKTENVVVLYTGDSAGIVSQVFRVTGLDRYFRFCFYGTEVKSRCDMVRLAIDKAEKMTGRDFSGKNTVVIGDSIRDIECGQRFNALAIAVATGFYSRAQLSAKSPDYLLDNMKNFKKVLRIIESE
jgi:phosphoglycolate phosphatase